MPELFIAVVVAGAVLVVAIAASQWRAITVLEYQQALKFTNGRLVGVLSAGRYRIWQPTTLIQIVDMRETGITIPGQELVTRDGISVKVSLAARSRIEDPRRAL